MLRPSFTSGCRFLLITILFTLVSLVAKGERLPLKSYTISDGLAHNSINRVVRDNRGFLWFCTAEGLSRFDGYGFTNFGSDKGLPHPNVTDFLQTRSGELWVGTYGGLVRFNPKGAPSNRVVYTNEVAVDFPPMFTVVVPEGNDRQARAITTVIEGQDGTIWVGTYGGLFRLEQTSKGFALHSIEIGMPTGRSLERFVTDLLEDRYGLLWIASATGLYRRWTDGSAARYTLSDGLPDENLHDLLQDHQGRLWGGTRLGGFFLFTADESHAPPKITRIYQLDGFAKWVFQLFETSDNRFWIATNKGLIEFSPEYLQFRIFTRRHGLSFQEISALAEDAGGNLWLGSVEGAMKLSREGFVTYDERDGLLAVGGIFGDRSGGVCFTASVLGDERRSVFEGAKLDVLHPLDRFHVRFGRFDGQNFTWFLPDVPKSRNFGWVGEGVTLQARNGEFWLGTGEGLYRFPASDDFTQIKHARPLAIYQTMPGSMAHSQIFQIFEDSAGNIWASTASQRNGLARWDRATETFTSELAESSILPSPSNDLARSFGEDRSGNIWIGFSTGLARYRDGSFTLFTSNDGVPPGAILKIYTDAQGRLWLASSRSGLIRVNDPTAQHPTFKSYTTAEGLASNNASLITEDLHGHIYVVTGRGLERVDPETNRIKHFTTADGLPADEIVTAFRAQNGELWFGTRRGLLRFSPAIEHPSPLPPPAIITGLRIAGVNQTLSALGESTIALAELAPDQNQIQIDFVGLSFAAGELLQYQYRLSGADDNWSAPTEQRSVTYTRLAPGSYQFLVRAINSEGLISVAPAIITFTVLRPVWQRWWFLSLVALTVLTLVVVAYRYRVARLVHLERVRTRIATDLHDDIGANLTRISLLSEVAKRGGGNGNLLTSIADIARESVSSMNDIVWAISPEYDRLLDLTRRMRQYAEEVFSLRDIKLEFNTSSPDSKMHLPASTRRDVLLIFKEAVNNAVRHSNCTQVRIDFHSEHQQLRLKIADNGNGFDKTPEREGQGLLSMQRRARMLGGELKIDSHLGIGTAVVLQLPLSKVSEI